MRCTLFNVEASMHLDFIILAFFSFSLYVALHRIIAAIIIQLIQIAIDPCKAALGCQMQYHSRYIFDANYTEVFGYARIVGSGRQG